MQNNAGGARAREKAYNGYESFSCELLLLVAIIIPIMMNRWTKAKRSIHQALLVKPLFTEKQVKSVSDETI